jgi:tetratricopeptide (TPR) repeat protein
LAKSTTGILLAGLLGILPATAQPADPTALREQLRAAAEVMHQGNHVESERLLLEILGKVRGSKEKGLLILTLNQLCITTHGLQKYREAERHCKECLELWERRMGPRHAELAFPLHSLARAYARQGRYSKAEALLLRALAIEKGAAGSPHPLMVPTLHELGYVNYQRRRFSEAEEYFRLTLALPASPDDRAATLHSLAGVLYRRGLRAESLSLAEEALALKENALGAGHSALVLHLLDLAVVYMRERQKQRAEPLVLRARQIAEAQLGPTHPLTGEAMLLQSQLLRKAGRKREARAMERQANAILSADQQARRAFEGLVDISDFAARDRR